MIRLVIQRLRWLVVIAVRLVIDRSKWLAAIGGVTAAAAHPALTTDLLHRLLELSHEAVPTVVAVGTLIEIVKLTWLKKDEKRNERSRKTTRRKSEKKVTSKDLRVAS